MLTEKYYGNFFIDDTGGGGFIPMEPEGTPKVLRITKPPRTILNQLCRVSKALKSQNQTNNSDIPAANEPPTPPVEEAGGAII